MKPYPNSNPTYMKNKKYIFNFLNEFSKKINFSLIIDQKKSIF